MRRIGSNNLHRLTVFLCVAASSSALAEVEFYQRVDRDQVGIEDSIHLTIVASGAAENAQIQFPTSPDFEVLSRSQSTEMSYQLGGAGASFRRTQKFVLVIRATRVGTLTLPSAVMTASGKTYRTEALKLIVKPGRTQDPSAARTRRGPPIPDPFQGFPFPGFSGGSDDGEEDQNPAFNVPRSEADVLLRESLDRQEIYAGDQVTLSVHILSRVDISGVDSVTLPKLDGFWSEDVESPTQLSGEQRMVNGVPYRAYLLKRLALFPVKAGTLKVNASEADITTGFIFTGRRVHRISNELSVRVKPLPPSAPPGFSTANVGRWKLSAEVSQSQVELGQPVTLKVALEGRGNVKNSALPVPRIPPALRIYDPTTTDKLVPSHGRIGGKRTQEFLVMPQQTGDFTLPALSFSYFDPESERYEETRTEPLALTVTPGSGGMTSLAPGDKSGGETQPKNVLLAGGPRPIRYQAHFSDQEEPVWRRRVFLPGLFAPPGLWLAFVLGGLVRAKLNHQDEKSLKRRQTKAAHQRLAVAERLKATGKPADFYGEVEKALWSFLEAKLGSPVAGLTRELLTEKLRQAGVADERRLRVFEILDSCDLARFAPGGMDTQRHLVLSEAQSLMESWNSK